MNPFLWHTRNSEHHSVVDQALEQTMRSLKSPVTVALIREPIVVLTTRRHVGTCVVSFVLFTFLKVEILVAKSSFFRIFTEIELHADDWQNAFQLLNP